MNTLWGWKSASNVAHRDISSSKHMASLNSFASASGSANMIAILYSIHAPTSTRVLVGSERHGFGGYAAVGRGVKGVVEELYGVAYADEHGDADEIGDGLIPIAVANSISAPSQCSSSSSLLKSGMWSLLSDESMCAVVVVLWVVFVEFVAVEVDLVGVV